MKTSSTLLSAARKRIAFVAFAAAAMGGTTLQAQAGPSHHGEAQCSSCGTVVSTRTYERAAESGSGLGVATGALVGGFLGNRVGSGNGRTLATVAGAVGGGYAGNHIEKNVRTTTVTDVRVRMSNGTVRKFTETGRNHYYNGQQVRVDHGQLIARR
jgi:outer membrane lipoprotein SlyB